VLSLIEKLGKDVRADEGETLDLQEQSGKINTTLKATRRKWLKMFGFFKKKIDTTNQATPPKDCEMIPTVTSVESFPSKDIEPTPPVIECNLEKSFPINKEMPRFVFTLDDVRLLAEVNWKSNESAMMHYAQCGGFSDDVSYRDFKEFHRIVFQSDPDTFTDKDKITASQMFFASNFRRTSNGFGSENVRIAELREAIKSGLLTPSTLQGIKIEQAAEVLFELVKKKRDKDWNMLISCIDEKFEYLAPIFRRLQGTALTKYGEYDSTAELQEIDEFIEASFEKDDFDFYYIAKPTAELSNYIDSRLAILNASSTIDMPEDGLEFEYWCASALTKQGWDTQVSKASGDQGIDIIARREGLSVAVQCKRYGQPIGNKAVQEVFAAKKFVGAKHACVIGTGGFTKSAKELAGAIEVFLFEAEGGLQNFSERFGFENLDATSLLNIDVSKQSDKYKVELRSTAEGAIGCLIRSGIKASAEIKDGFGEERVGYILDQIDAETGKGQIECSAGELGLLLVLVKVALDSEVEMSLDVYDSLSKSKIYNGASAVSDRIGELVKIKELFSSERLESIEELIEINTSKLPQHYQLIANNLDK
jgi:hypothetical protein